MDRVNHPAAAGGTGFRADTYGESFADVYDDWYGDATDAAATAAFVAARCGGRPVLELGIGTGRLARPLCEFGIDVVGVDASAAMLRLFSGRRQGPPPTVRLVQADMAALPLRRAGVGAGFGAVLIGFNTLFNVPTAPGQAALVAQLPALLADGGVVIIETQDLGALASLASGPTGSIGVKSRTADALTVVGTRLDPNAQTIAGQHVELTATGARFRPWLLRWATPTELDRYATDAGLALAERYTDWHGTPTPASASALASSPTSGSDVHISVYGRDEPTGLAYPPDREPDRGQRRHRV